MIKNNPHSTFTSTATHRPASGRSAPRRPDRRQHVDPLDYDHPWPSMAGYARRLALRTDASRTRHSYNCSMRLIHQHAGCDPALITEDQLLESILALGALAGVLGIWLGNAFNSGFFAMRT